MDIEIDKVCTTLWQQARGLMFSKKRTLLFRFNKEKHVIIHNWFVFYPITLLYLNKKDEVIEIKKNLRPFTHYSPKKNALSIIELPYELDIEIGEKIRIIKKKISGA